jgi:hypothetical protein
LPKSQFGKAINYALNQWEALLVYASDGRLEIDNNFLASGKLGKGGRASNSETFYWNPAGVNPAWQSRASSQKRVLRGAG